MVFNFLSNYQGNGFDKNQNTEPPVLRFSTFYQTMKGLVLIKIKIPNHLCCGFHLYVKLFRESFCESVFLFQMQSELKLQIFPRPQVATYKLYLSKEAYMQIIWTKFQNWARFLKTFLFYFILFYFILFCFILFYFISFYFILICLF